ncbi:MAG: hypothetical protein IJJ55_03170 [Clostridia bacterium]|nr:hypothetical protein [Clostridia bacterium]
MKKLLSLITALALTASMAVLPAMAEGETEQVVAPTGDAVTVTALPKDTVITFNATESYTTNTKVGDYLAVYAREDGAVSLDTTGKTIEGVQYPGRLKTGGAAYKGEETDEDYGTIKSRLISVTPAEAGTLSIIFAHASSSGTTRTFAINQSGKEIAAMDVEASEVKTIKANVAANVPVYIYSKSSGINIYSIKLNELDTSTPTPEPTAMPIVKLPKDTNIKFDTQKTISATELYNDNTIVYVGTGDSVTVDESNKTIDGRAYTTRMKFGSAKLDASGIPTSRAFSLIPAADGILKVDFAATNKTDAKSLTAIQEGSESVTENVPADGTATLSMAVKADVPVYVYSTVGANVYGYILIDTSAEIVPQKMPINTTVTFESGIGTNYNTTGAKALFGDYVLVMPKGGDTDKTRIDESNKTIPEGGTKYTATLKLGGKGSRTERAVEIIPAAAGTLRVPFIHASSTATENAVLKAYQDGAVVGSQEVAPDAANGAVLEAEVVADKPVYIYSETQGSNIYAIILAKDLAPEKLQPGDNIVFDSGYNTETQEGTTFNEATIFGDKVLVIPDASGKTQIAKSSKTIGDVKYNTTLKLGGTGSTTSRAIEVIPAAAGTLKIPFIHASSTEGADNAVLKAYQDGEVIGSAEVAQGNDAGNVLEVNVAADKPVYIYAETQGANIYAVIFDSSAPADPEIYEITATYSSNALTNVTWTKVKTSAAKPDKKTAEKLVAHWKTIEGMEPVVITASTPE